MQKTGVQSSQKGYEFFKNAEKRPIFLDESSEISWSRAFKGTKFSKSPENAQPRKSRRHETPNHENR